MSRRPHFRPSHVVKLKAEPPFTDATVAELFSDFLRNRLAALDPAEATQLTRSFNSRHAGLLAQQEGRDRYPDPEGKDIEALNREVNAVRRRLRKIKQRRDEALQATRGGEPTRIFFAELAVQEINAHVALAERIYLPQTIITPDWLHGLLDEIEAALRATNPTARLSGRSKESVVVLIAEAVLPLISGMTVEADAISQHAVRQRRRKA